LPEVLEPEHLQRMQGLRTRVIRSMFFLYEPMADAYFGKAVKIDPNILRGRTCMKMWNQVGYFTVSFLYTYFYNTSNIYYESTFEDQKKPGT